MNRLITAALALSFVCGQGALAAERNVVRQRELIARTNPYLRQLRFSPDGAYILAQTDSTITLLTAVPFAIAFQVPAEDSELADFTPDSRGFSFIEGASALHVGFGVARKLTYRAHVEHWEISSRTHSESAAIPLEGCASYKLSPDGHMLACADYAGALRVIDSDSMRTVYEERKWSKTAEVDGPDSAARRTRLVGMPGAANIDYSTDGRYLRVAPTWSIAHTVALELPQGIPVERGGLLKGERPGYSAFISPTTMIMSRYALTHLSRASVVEFPTGRKLRTMKLSPEPLDRAADSHLVIVRPYILQPETRTSRKTGAAAVEYETGRVIVSQRPALDVWGERYVAEPNDGEVGLYEIGRGLQATIRIAGSSANPSR